MLQLDTIEFENKENARRKERFQEYLHSVAYQEKLIRRLEINDACSRSSEARILTYNLCMRPDNPAEGCIFFIENFGYTFDPRPPSAPHHLPFILFDYQKETIHWLIDHINNGKDGLIEKSRDMGISWIVFVWVMVWYWLFRDGFNGLLGSYKEDLVDNRTKDSLFGMVDYAILSLPKWILPKGFSKDKNRTHMKLVNPANGNLITGDTMNPDFGRGSRKTVIAFDELGSWDYAKDAWEAAGDSTSCRIANSTPKGYNYYAMLRDSGIDVLTLHWKRNPLKDQQWYEYEKERRTEEEVAQELDISYNKSQEGRVYPEWNDVNVQMKLAEYDENLPLYVGWDFGQTDDTAIIWMQQERGRWKIVDCYRSSGKTIDFYIPFVTGIQPSDGYKYTKEDLEMIDAHKAWKRGIHFGDPAGRFTNQVVNTSVIEMLRLSGIVINFKEHWQDFQTRKTAAKLIMMDGIDLNSNPRTRYFNLCMTSAAYPRVKDHGVLLTRSVKPKHDWTSHYRSAFEYLCLGVKELRLFNVKPHDKFPRKESSPSARARRGTGY